ncbi:hypothetical protein COCC4DRAFT_60662 [Bipolaris maydis ATCC 48331]|uniref:Uncharacterized protein n=2 Tax=Cochliobolus heterostrophus TaxID=5016 RepID=M2U4K1_COCH5|nr:uncharacterized protein COCC4DRAFT_60662 [Bipolaris maydis ATCC 48331]EMD88676.1 hypothetical protein COCHEDRAFT_1216567 [Bipolaris maydis C5]KAJ5028730.1 hypothetical protein J3E73DRAFT_407714 [Bipolaris maydis]ENI05607.1 hypothetical protein COCC4DRAFT_60662 [Bipolaris maydis ATCC 48331]KAJ5063519.1 hypothetical protein J3E74DRAFT_446126 [Bipolaris maydis]KAJ6199778.1 hypothetical protein J3E72DRAFT_414052 [Bipolaris maydis]
MRSFHQIPLALCALVATAVATTSQDTISYDATVYITSTITRINTVTASSSPTGAPVNQTSTIVASHPSVAPSFSSLSSLSSFSSFNAGNATSVAPTAAPSAPTAALPSASAPAAFPGAASSLTANAYLALVAAGLGYLVL